MEIKLRKINNKKKVRISIEDISQKLNINIELSRMRAKKVVERLQQSLDRMEE